MLLLEIIFATLIGGVLSVFLAASLGLSFLSKFANRMVAFSVGILLGFAFTDLLPQALSLGIDAFSLGWVLIAGIMGFFLLEKVALWRHDHSASLGIKPAKPVVSMIILGDSMHNFVDGVLIAAAFLTDSKLGWATTIAVTAHEIPQEISDFIVLLNAGVSKIKSILLNTLSGFAMTLGGIIGWLSLNNTQSIIPYILTLAAASFTYIAIADLVPELHHHRKPEDMFFQISLMAIGLLVVSFVKKIEQGGI